jgi:predicted O-methyltransferase YrrM
LTLESHIVPVADYLTGEVPGGAGFQPANQAGRTGFQSVHNSGQVKNLPHGETGQATNLSYGNAGQVTSLPHKSWRLQREHAPAGTPIPLASGLRYDQLLEYVAAAPSLEILEIGVARGANALRMLALADLLGGKPHYTGVDLFDRLSDELLRDEFVSPAKRPLSRQQTWEHLRERLGADIARRVRLLEGFSSEVLPTLRAEGARFDLLFIDGGHSLEAVKADWQECERLVSPGGTIVFDDYPNWGVRAVVESIDQTRWSVRILPHVDSFRNTPTADDPTSLRHHQLVEVRPLRPE